MAMRLGVEIVRLNTERQLHVDRSTICVNDMTRMLTRILPFANTSSLNVQRIRIEVLDSTNTIAAISCKIHLSVYKIKFR